MHGELHMDVFALPRDARSAGLSQAAERWGRLAYGAALAFVANLYASPAFYWPEIFEPARLGVVTSAVCAFAVLMRRVTSGERLRLGGPPAALLLAYLLMHPLSFAWTISQPQTLEAVVDMAKMLVVYVALLNALDTPVFLPAALLLVAGTKRPWLKVLLLFSAAANVTAIILTHSRSGTIAMAAAVGFALLRGRARGRGLVLAGAALMAVVALAPQSFWMRQSSIADYEEDASFAGRERAYAMLRVIFDERPLTGVGAGGFLDAWARFAPLSAGGQRLIAHNIFMEILGELGLLALLLFAAFCAWLLWRLWRAGAAHGGVEARAVFAGLVGYLICELVNGYSRSFNLYTAFALAVAVVLHTRRREELRAEAAAG